MVVFGFPPITRIPVHLRDAHPSDFPDILDINEESLHYLSPLTTESLADLHEQSVYHRVIEDEGTVVAFLLVLGTGVRYDSLNYDWFTSRFADFLYIDRISVRLSHQSLRLGSMLYEDLFRFADESAYSLIACEYNLKPLNEISQRFHIRHGFREVGRRSAKNGAKIISMQVRE